MLIRNWMTSEVITVTPETSVSKASRLMQDHDIRRLPVVDTQMNAVGIVTDTDIKAASPSQATSLDMHEVQYLLSELKIKEIMTVKPMCVNINDSVEHVAMLMEDNSIGSLPVTDDDDKLAGIITDHDIFKLLLSITGARKGGIQLAFELKAGIGGLQNIFSVLKAHGVRIISVLTHYEDDEDIRRYFVRIRPLGEKQDELLALLKEQHGLAYWV